MDEQASSTSPKPEAMKVYPTYIAVIQSERPSSWVFILRKGSRAEGLKSPGTSPGGSERIVPRYLKMHTRLTYSSPAYCATSVPAGMPSKPSPSQPATPKVSSTDAATFTTFTTRSVHIELIESCIPTNQPLKLISKRVAGAAQMRMLK